MFHFNNEFKMLPVTFHFLPFTSTSISQTFDNTDFQGHLEVVMKSRLESL